MAEGDLIYVPTASNGIGYKLGGSALAYKKAIPTTGDTLSWTSGDITLNGYPRFTSPITLDTLAGSITAWYWYARPNISNPDPGAFMRLQANMINASGTYEIQFIGYTNNQLALYTKSGGPAASYPSLPMIGTYTRITGNDYGTVAISA